MTGLPERGVTSNCPAGSSTAPIDSDSVSGSSERETGRARSSRTSSWSSFFASAFSILEAYTSSSPIERKETKTRTRGWTAALKKPVTCGSMRRLQERILGSSKTDVMSSTSEIWLLGECYKISPKEPSGDDNGLVEFLYDFSSRIWMTYRKGFDPIGDSKFTSDVYWGCMIRSSQMLVAQALLFHNLGRSWRKPSEKPYNAEYIELLHLFGDSAASAFSIHNLVQAGRGYGLAAGSWTGPYAMCRSWETLARVNRVCMVSNKAKCFLPMALYVVSGDEDGERGGAPVLCTDVASNLCSEFCEGEVSWAPILFLIPLVLGLDKVNPRYLPLLQAMFAFPQSLGILGGKPGASTYIIGVQDDRVLYLDPHEVQPVAHIAVDNLEADTSSYHCSTVRHMPLDQIDPSLAIGFYCRDRDDFDDLCARAIELALKSNGAPLFTVDQSHRHPKPIHHDDSSTGEFDFTRRDGMKETFDLENFGDSGAHPGEDDWQLL